MNRTFWAQLYRAYYRIPHLRVKWTKIAAVARKYTALRCHPLVRPR